jgi:hypothetical protein
MLDVGFGIDHHSFDALKWQRLQGSIQSAITPSEPMGAKLL